MEFLLEHLGIALAIGAVSLATIYVLQKQSSKKIPERKKGVVYMYTLPPAWKSPSGSAFCSKLDVWLKIANIPHETIITSNPGPKGKFPYIEIDGEIIADSSVAIDFLKKKYNVTIDDELSPLDKAHALAFKRLIEEHLYFCVVTSRFAGDEWDTVRKEYFKEGNFFVRHIVPLLVQRAMKQNAWGQGIGRHSKQEIERMAIDDITAISTFLADKQYFMGSKLTTIDATVWAWLDGFFGAPMNNSYVQHAKSLPNLVEYHQRIHQLFYK